MKAPVIASKPHFLGGDTELFEAVDGMKPDLLKHETYGDFHLVSSDFKI